MFPRVKETAEAPEEGVVVVARAGAEYEELARIEGPGICADGDVQSVLLKCNRPIEQVRTVRPDAASRTSNALARIVMAKHFHCPVKMCSPDDQGDAQVVIGDRAMRQPPVSYSTV